MSQKKTMNETADTDRKKKDMEVRIRNFRMIDDLFFCAVLDGDTELTGKILSIILKKKIHIVSVKAEDTVIDIIGKSIRADLIAVDDHGNRYIIEAQKDRRGMDPRRLAYELAKISDGIVEKGSKDWKQIKRRYVIMFCETDFIGKGEAVTYGKTVFAGQERDIAAEMIYVNCAYKGNDEIGRLVHDMLCSNPDDIYDDEIREKVKLVKEGGDIVTMCEVLDEVVMAERRAARAKLAKKNRELKRKDDALKIKDEELKRKDDALKSKDDELKRKDEEIERMRNENERLKQRFLFSSGS